MGLFDFLCKNDKTPATTENRKQDENKSPWGVGIPQYTKNDVLAGLELHAFCTNAVAQTMQNEGYIIEGVILDNTPTQVIANKDGKRTFVIVAGDVYPHEGKISFEMKMKFARFCKSQNVVPMFASVGIMSIDEERSGAGLALKNDGFYIKYTGNEDLTCCGAPSTADSEYKAYCIERIIQSYKMGEFNALYPLFDENIQLHSQWVMNPTIGKLALVEYYDRKGKAIRNSNTKLDGTCVIITEAQKRNGNFVLMSEAGKVCALISQEIDGKTNWIFISTKFNEQNKLTEISINDPSLFSFKPYYAFE